MPYNLRRIREEFPTLFDQWSSQAYRLYNNTSHALKNSGSKDPIRPRLGESRKQFMCRYVKNEFVRYRAESPEGNLPEPEGDLLRAIRSNHGFARALRKGLEVASEQ